MTKNDKENKAFYNRIHFFGYEDEKELREEFEEMLDDCEDDDDNDDLLIGENF